EDRHLDEAEQLQLAHQDGERDDRGRLDIKDDEEHARHQILDWKAPVRRLHLLDATLIRRQFLRRWALGAEHESGKYDEDGEGERQSHQDENRHVFWHSTVLSGVVVVSYARRGGARYFAHAKA